MSITRFVPYLLALCLSAMCVSVYGIGVVCARNLVLLGALLYLSIMDFRYYIIPDKALVVAVLAWCGAIPFAYQWYGGVVGIGTAVASALVFGGGMLLFTLLMDHLLKKETMGGGDIKLFAVLGLYLGMPESLFALFLSCAFGLCFALICIGRDRPQIPFGPSIALAGWIMLLYGDFVVDWYIKMI